MLRAGVRPLERRVHTLTDSFSMADRTQLRRLTETLKSHVFEVTNQYMSVFSDETVQQSNVAWMLFPAV